MQPLQCLGAVVVTRDILIRRGQLLKALFEIAAYLIKHCPIEAFEIPPENKRKGAYLPDCGQTLATLQLTDPVLRAADQVAAIFLCEAGHPACGLKIKNELIKHTSFG